jgi:adenylate cyclase
MNIEIERKFLVKGDYKKFAIKSYKIAQGFLSSAPERTVRIRIKDASGFITVKGISNQTGASRFEWEKEITLKEAEELLATNDNLFFEVDEFVSENAGLLIAEIELPNEHFIFEKPKWLGKEVTGELKYYNSVLSKNPYSNW